tara:strand:+ start:768 stop:1217 length:450 start_codon:yes stop_codon:yes gene_type:complete
VLRFKTEGRIDMFEKIMVPVDLRHVEKMGKTLKVASEIAAKHDAEVVFIGVTSQEPSEFGHNAKEYAAKLDDFAQSHANEFGHKGSSKAVIVPDPAVDLDKTLLKTADDLGADLVVMATHVPNAANYLFASHGGHLAAHSDASVFLVRG